ncbi:MAG: 16S rRNA methyltransferase, partial [Treponema sp.]|nr:16S rRNA methyltransferase [Treponema sp.]
MNICLFEPEELGRPLDLRDERAKHILSVLHKGEGDSFSAGVIGGSSGQARIERIERAEMTAANGKSYTGGSMTFSFVPEGDGKPLYPLAMLIGFPRPIQLKRLLRDMAGLG